MVNYLYVIWIADKIICYSNGQTNHVIKTWLVWPFEYQTKLPGNLMILSIRGPVFGSPLYLYMPIEAFMVLGFAWMFNKSSVLIPTC